MKLAGPVLEQVAAAYALGTLGERARRRFEALLARDIGARRAWQEWEQRLSALTPELPSVRPPDTAWSAIEQRLQGRPRVPTPSRARWMLAAALLLAIAVVLWTGFRP